MTIVPKTKEKDLIFLNGKQIDDIILLTAKLVLKKLSMFPRDVRMAIITDNMRRIRKTLLSMKVHKKAPKKLPYEYAQMIIRALNRPRSLIGLLVSGSLGEELTQGTLNTFHFVGLGSARAVVSKTKHTDNLLSMADKPETTSMMLRFSDPAFVFLRKTTDHVAGLKKSRKFDKYLVSRKKEDITYMFFTNSKVKEIPDTVKVTDKFKGLLWPGSTPPDITRNYIGIRFRMNMMKLWGDFTSLSAFLNKIVSDKFSYRSVFVDFDLNMTWIWIQDNEKKRRKRRRTGAAGKTEEFKIDIRMKITDNIYNPIIGIDLVDIPGISDAYLESSTLGSIILSVEKIGEKQLAVTLNRSIMIQTGMERSDFLKRVEYNWGIKGRFDPVFERTVILDIKDPKVLLQVIRPWSLFIEKKLESPDGNIWFKLKPWSLFIDLIPLFREYGGRADYGKGTIYFRAEERVKEAQTKGFRCLGPLQLYYIKTTGSNLSEAIKHPTFGKRIIFSSNIIEVARVYGIEMAVDMLIQEFAVLSSEHNIRNLILLAENICQMGIPFPVTRTGLHELQHSTLHQAAFEITTKRLLEGAVAGDDMYPDSPVVSILTGSFIDGVGLRRDESPDKSSYDSDTAIGSSSLSAISF